MPKKEDYKPRIPKKIIVEIDLLADELDLVQTRIALVQSLIKTWRGKVEAYSSKRQNNPHEHPKS